MGEKSTSGGKSTLVQAPQKSSAPIQTGTKQNGFVRSSKNKGTTAGEQLSHLFNKPQSAYKIQYGDAPDHPYKTLTRNDKCGCGSGVKYKKCCYYKIKNQIPPLS